MQFLVRKRKRQLVGSLATPLYRYLCMPQLLHACSFCMPRRLPSGWRFLRKLLGTQKIPGSEEPGIVGAPEGIRTPNLLIRSQMLYPLSYRRMFLASDFFNPSRQQVLLYGCPRGCASRKSRNLSKIPSLRVGNTPFYRGIPGFLRSQNFFKIFLSRVKTHPEGTQKYPSAPFRNIQKSFKKSFCAKRM